MNKSQTFCVLNTFDSSDHFVYTIENVEQIEIYLRYHDSLLSGYKPVATFDIGNIIKGEDFYVKEIRDTGKIMRLYSFNENCLNWNSYLVDSRFVFNSKSINKELLNDFLLTDNLKYKKQRENCYCENLIFDYPTFFP
ncbi:MAG: hypothetical protein IPK03_08855 [Bacteroidetes bacterium]|nr:hypothetical protein [Bacteroidota bacterium]